MLWEEHYINKPLNHSKRIYTKRKYKFYIEDAPVQTSLDAKKFCKAAESFSKTKFPAVADEN